ncbi:hypothetical protein GWO43_02695 [candidate division KSB1 bacterium]|nr:hypothetical protein [candidate division KSB1 bacterium]NIR69779.1 hypothetical protein [candidate division KSB1 bacterium]NIS22962.1 hypothetical protein [candidate division KSB1 bacterium]NIT69819.1 hypothetical protein [candidate division KSB1 bacterium]NIU23493.1 hypothetical protein [candidate division KSB1 bacterium]
MSGKKLLIGALIVSLAGLVSCTKSTDSEIDMASLSEAAMQGKEVFERHECIKCHAMGEARSDTSAPDLSDPFLANDSMFVEVHLKFAENTKMPPIELTDEEVRLLSHYVAQLHRAKHPSVSPEEADAFCPVCFAPVSTEQAEKDRLYVTFLDEKYYFECEECEKAFRKAPEAFRELMKMRQKALAAAESP